MQSCEREQIMTKKDVGALEATEAKLETVRGYKSFYDSVSPSLDKMQEMGLDEEPSGLIAERAIKTINQLRARLAQEGSREGHEWRQDCGILDRSLTLPNGTVVKEGSWIVSATRSEAMLIVSAGDDLALVREWSFVYGDWGPIGWDAKDRGQEKSVEVERLIAWRPWSEVYPNQPVPGEDKGRWSEVYPDRPAPGEAAVEGGGGRKACDGCGATNGCWCKKSPPLTAQDLFAKIGTQGDEDG
jgi:hypothetical protein